MRQRIKNYQQYNVKNMGGMFGMPPYFCVHFFAYNFCMHISFVLYSGVEKRYNENVKDFIFKIKQGDVL